MPQPSHNENSGQFHNQGNQLIGNTINADGGNISFSSGQQILNTSYSDIQIGGNALVHLGHQFNGVTINAKVAARSHYIGHYAHNALLPVANYTERKNLHRQIEAQLHDRIDTNETRTQVLVVHGIGGAGKTQLVMNYVQQRRLDYSAVFWLEARSKESIERDYIQIYILLYDIDGVGRQESIRLEDAVPAVKRWFYQRAKKWLFVFDSADNIDAKDVPSYIDLRYFLPDDPSIHVIVTTRDSSAIAMSSLEAIEVGKMEQEEAIALFKKQARISSTVSRDDVEVLNIVQELGYLALAIILAGSYVSTIPRLRADIAKYLPEYRARRKDLLDQKPDWLIHQYGESVLVTWETTYHAMHNQHPEACQFLGLLAFLHGDDIFFDFGALIPDDDSSSWTSIVSTQTVNRQMLEQLLSVLQRRSFLSFRAEQGSYAMHKLVQVWSYDRLDQEQQKSIASAAVSLLCSIIDSMEAETPARKERLIPHLMISFDKFKISLQLSGLEDRDLFGCLLKMTAFLGSCGRYKDVSIIQRAVLLRYNEIYGEEHLLTVSAMNNLACTLDETGDLQEALSLSRKAFEINRRALGEEHLNTISTMRTLAGMLTHSGEFSDALSLERKVLEVSVETLGKEHPDTVLAMHNLATTLYHLGDLQEALSMQREVLEARTRIFGEEHPNTISAMANLSQMAQALGNSQEAMSLNQKVLETRTRILGDEHPDTIVAMGNLASLLHSQGDLQEALSMKRKVLQIRTRILGEDHPDTVQSMGNLAYTLYDLGELQEALSIERKVLEMKTRILGKQHPSTISAMGNLSSTLRKLGELQEALSMKRKVLEIQTEMQGEDHPDTILAMGNLASVLQDLGVSQEALSLKRKVLEMRTRRLGEEHPDTVSAMGNLAYALDREGEFREALAMEREVLRVRTKILGEEHPDTLLAMHNMASTLDDLAEFQEALSIQQSVVAKTERALGDTHPRTVLARENLEVYLEHFNESHQQKTVSKPKPSKARNRKKHLQRSKH